MEQKTFLSHTSQAGFTKTNGKKIEHAGLMHRINNELVFQCQNRRLPRLWFVIDRENGMMLLRAGGEEHQVGWMSESGDGVKFTLNLEGYNDICIRMSRYALNIVDGDVSEKISREVFLEV